MRGIPSRRRRRQLPKVQRVRRAPDAQRPGVLAVRRSLPQRKSASACRVDYADKWPTRRYTARANSHSWILEISPRGFDAGLRPPRLRVALNTSSSSRGRRASSKSAGLCYYCLIRFLLFELWRPVAHGIRPRPCSSSVSLSCAAFHSFRKRSTGRPQRSCASKQPNSFPSCLALSTASQPPYSAHRAMLYEVGSMRRRIRPACGAAPHRTAAVRRRRRLLPVRRESRPKQATRRDTTREQQRYRRGR